MCEVNFGKSYLGFLLVFICSILPSSIHAQEDKELKKTLREAQTLLSEANTEIDADNFVDGEADYRTAISLDPKDETGRYNLGNAYYNEKLNDQAMRRFSEAAEIASDKEEKHKAYHNLGNTLMNAKDYQGAVEAYKNALRNDPTDDETRYNLALAKDMLEKNPPKGGGDNEDENNEDEKEEQNEDGDNKEGDNKEEKENEDKGDEKEENKKGENEDKGNPDKPNEEKKEQQQPVPGKLSPQQVKNLLEAMNNEEKKVQEKINARKQKGARVKSNKDW